MTNKTKTPNAFFTISSLKVVLIYKSRFYYTKTVTKGKGKTSEFFGLAIFKFGTIVEERVKRRCDDLLGKA